MVGFVLLGWGRSGNVARVRESLGVALAQMARDLLAQDSVQATLDRIGAHAVALVDGCEAAGIMAVRNRRVDTLTATDHVSRASDRVQGELGEGPCFDAVRQQQQVYRIGDVTSREQRWPRYVQQARKLGVGSMMGFLLSTKHGRDFDALNLYSTRPEAFTEASEQVGWLLASHAAVALSSTRTYAHLREANATRQDIGEALGIVMERHHLTEQAAFAMLTRTSQHRNIKLREIARTVARTGEIPGPVDEEPGAGGEEDA